MKKYILTFLTILFISTTAFSQEITKTLLNDNLKVMFININNKRYDQINHSSVIGFINNSPRVFFFEIVYNGEVLFRESFRKAAPSPLSSEPQNLYMFRNIMLDADKISDSDKLKLMENYRNGIVEKAGKKFMHLNDFSIIYYDYDTKEFAVTQPLENMRVNIYMLEFN